MKKIGVIVGSLRKDSFNRKMAKAMIALAPKGLDFEIIDISPLSLYNQDLDENSPKEWTDFRNKIKACDGILFFTPEYNRSVPGVLKNVIDIGSRPNGQNSWNKKPAAVVSVSPGPYGAFGANHHLRQSLMVLNMPTLQTPEAYIANVSKIMDEKGTLTDEKVKALSEKFMAAYAEWVERNSN